MKMEAAVVLLMMMLVRDKTTSSFPGKSYCASHDLPVSIVNGPARLGKQQVSRIVTAAMDAYGLVVPHQPRCRL